MPDALEKQQKNGLARRPERPQPFTEAAPPFFTLRRAPRRARALGFFVPRLTPGRGARDGPITL